MRRTLVTALICAATAAATCASALVAPADATPSPTIQVEQAPLLPLPQELDRTFYRPPAAKVAAARPGEVLSARKINAALFSLAPLNVDAWQLSFRSTNTQGQPIPAVTTILRPRGAPKDGFRKVVSMQIAEDSTAGYCATSYAVQQFNAAPLAGQVVAPAELLIAQGFLAQGYTLVLPDHEGPNQAYAAGPLGGRIILDSLRAVKSFAPSQVTEESPIGLYGYSGGAIVTGHATELRQSYAPDVKIVGAAQGGVPADLREMLLYAQNKMTSGLILGAILGLSREYKYFDTFLRTHTNPLGQGLLRAKGPLCIQYQALTAPFMNNIGLLNWPGNPLNAPAVKRVLSETKMGAVRPDVPLYIWNARHDQVVPIHQVDTLVRSYCKKPGPSITYTRDHVSEHLTGEVVGTPMAMLWLKDRLDGKEAKAGCTTRNELSLVTNTKWWPQFSTMVGNNLSALFGAAIGRGK